MDRRRWLIGLAASVAAVLAGCGGSASDELYPLWVPTDVIVADIDGDGRNDVLALSQLASSESQREGVLSVRLQTSSGTFAPAVSYRVGAYPWKMALDDIDGDGAADLAIVDVGISHLGVLPAVWLLRQSVDRRGSFDAPQRLALDPVRPYDVAIGDMNGDGAPDIVVADSLAPGRGATLLYQDVGNRGSFLPPTLLALPGDATQLAISDLNGDGRPDLAVRLFVSRTDYVPNTLLALVYQQADGTLGGVTTLSAQTGLNTAMLAATDYNGDGARDIAEFFTSSDTPYPSKVTVLLQQSPPGSFVATDTSLASLRGRMDGVVADLNADGRPDFACVGFYPVGSPTTVESTLHLLWQDGSGGFNPVATIAMPVSASRLSAGDLDGDGRNDLVVLGSKDAVFVLRQSAGSPGTFLPPAPL